MTMTQRERAELVRGVHAVAGAGFVLAVALFVTHAAWPPAVVNVFTYPLPQVGLGVTCAIVYKLVD